ncbi:MAG TPA: cytochrome c oxidase accessory protein CcoG, partial [Alphaproteobacteria bacterium]|nr:cytochrome c oxidase accessory protein CcoG [Alphaproteobacteria bacterium]
MVEKKIKVEIEESGDLAGEIIFEKRSKIYQAKVSGTFRKLKTIVSYLFLLAFFAMPFLRYERAGDMPDQAVMVDLTLRKFFFFAIEIWPQEAYYFIGLLVFSAIFLFFITSLFGRVWCGYACPQTIFSDLFYRVEEFVEGSYQKRQRQDKKVFTRKVLPKKILKHSIWLALSLLTGATVTFYFADAYKTVSNIITLQASYSVYFWTLFLTATTYIFAGFAREYICIYACPYARFQGAMMDADSLVVTYDEVRGEPRGKQNSHIDTESDCVDCYRCVVVCPVGIDIRDGQQYQCINCGLCVDACNDIMTKLKKPDNLIRYDTLRNLNREAKGLSSNFKILRPRTII